MIEAQAVLHQATRKRDREGRIVAEVDEEDIPLVRVEQIKRFAVLPATSHRRRGRSPRR